jgi:putative transposase
MHLRKPIRLAPKNYRGKSWYFITACTQYRFPFFNQPSLAESMVKILIEAASHRSFLLHAWCLMPDHIHILCQGAKDQSTLIMFVNRWKVKSSSRFKRERDQDIWQRSFHDHILRPKDHAHAFLWYIWMNPVRKGLCKNASDYPWSGSQTIDWKRGSQPKQSWTPPWKKPKNESAVKSRENPKPPSLS